MEPVAIITAAGKGIGAACAKELAGRQWRVALMSPSGSAERLADELGGVGISGSVAETGDIERLVSMAMDAYGRVDAVINNTGHAAKGSLLELTDEQWHDGLRLLLLNVVCMARCVTSIMQRQGGGSIVNISTFAAIEPDARFPISSTMRAALGAYAKLYARQYAADNIRMNNVLPGFVDSFPVDEKNIATIPAARYARVDEIARAVAFLASEESSYVTGQSLRVDGGLTRGV